MAHLFAVVILIYYGIGLVWDVLDPDAVKVKFNSAFRAVVALVAQMFTVTAALSILGCTAAVIVAIIACYLLVTVFWAAASGEI